MAGSEPFTQCAHTHATRTKPLVADGIRVHSVFQSVPVRTSNEQHATNTINVMANENWWKIYLETVYQSEEELRNYARQSCQTHDRDIQERLQQLQGTGGAIR